MKREEIEKELEGEQIKIQPSRMCQGGHHFRYSKGLEVKCEKCPVGYILPIGGALKDGHVYINEELVI